MKLVWQLISGHVTRLEDSRMIGNTDVCHRFRALQADRKVAPTRCMESQRWGNQRGLWKAERRTASIGGLYCHDRADDLLDWVNIWMQCVWRYPLERYSEWIPKSISETRDGLTDRPRDGDTRKRYIALSSVVCAAVLWPSSEQQLKNIPHQVENWIIANCLGLQPGH